MRLGAAFLAQVPNHGRVYDLAVGLGGQYTSMPQQFLDGRDVYALVKQERRTGMPRRVEQNPQSTRQQTSKDKT